MAVNINDDDDEGCCFFSGCNNSAQKSPFQPSSFSKWPARQLVVDRRRRRRHRTALEP